MTYCVIVFVLSQIEFRGSKQLYCATHFTHLHLEIGTVMFIICFVSVIVFDSDDSLLVVSASDE